MNKTIVTHGAGYVGLTGAVHAALAGYNVILYDPDPKVVAAINSGKPRAGEYLGYIDDNIQQLVGEGKIVATLDFDFCVAHDIHLLAVPTEKNDKPFMDIVIQTIIKLAVAIPENGLIIVESTLQPGTIDRVYLSLHDISDKFHLAVCPRLDWFADKEKNLTNLPRIVGGYTPEATQKACEVLTPICKDLRPTNHRAAEMAKSGQNSLYFTQVMAAYKMAEMYQNFTDMNEVLRLIGIHWRLPNLYLGPGTSGRCVAMGAKYIEQGSPSAYDWNSPFAAALRYDTYWREKIGDTITKRYPFSDSQDIKILVMGIAYSPNFSDFGYSAGLDIAKYLHEFEWKVSINDPVISPDTLKKIAGDIPIVDNELSSFYATENRFDAILLATAHDAYKDLPPIIRWKKGQYILDATGLWEKYRAAFKSLEVKYVRVGEQGWMNL
jgi:nucleotide sugar dehydrogenase